MAYTYDGLGRQVSRTTGSSTRTDFWFDASGMTLESGASNLTYLRDPAGLPLSVANGSALHNYGRDRLGSITGLTSSAQSLAASSVYDPYGSTVAQTGSVANSLKFTGGRQDPTSTWYTLGQRTYAPELARFTSVDPLPSSITDLNRYAYAGCNPSNFVDPTGTETCWPVAGAALLATGEVAGTTAELGLATAVTAAVAGPLAIIPAIAFGVSLFATVTLLDIAGQAGTGRCSDIRLRFPPFIG